MTFQVIPKEQAFFDLFEKAAENTAAGARELQAMIDDFPNASARGERIQEFEHAGDDVTHEIMALLNTTFVVPFDRDDIYELASTLDDVLDAQEAVSDLLVLLGIREALPEFRQQVDVMVRATGVINRAMRGLRSPMGMEKYWVEITRLEREGDRVHHRGVASLFSGDFKAMEVLKWKDIVEQMEWGIDRCEDVANAIESIALKYA